MLQARVEQQEKENTILVASSPDMLEKTLENCYPVAPPPIKRRGHQLPPSKQQQHARKVNVTSIRPRRILNSKAQQQQQEAKVELVDLTKVENMEDERHVHVIPIPNFDDSNDD